MNLIRLLMMLGFVSVGNAWAAQEDDLLSQLAKPLPSTVTYHTSYFNDDSLEHRLTWDHSFTGGERMSLSASYADLQMAQEQLITRALNLGIRDNPIKTISVGGELGYWGNASALTTYTISLYTESWLDSWQLRVAPQYRLLSVYGEAQSASTLTTRSRFDVDNYGVSFNLAYQGFENWTHRLHGSYQSYSEDLTRFDVDKFNAELEAFLREHPNAEDLLYADLATILAFARQNNLTEQQLRQVIDFRTKVRTVLTVFSRFADGISLSTSFENYSAGYEIGYAAGNAFLAFDYAFIENAITRELQQQLTLDASYTYKGWSAGVGYVTFTETPEYWTVQCYLAVPLD